eukprot:m.242272 g.242272  ORF g.242272 m.242272 type:complete len:594 (-) comp19440_c0_seq1:267-2048(-)
MESNKRRRTVVSSVSSCPTVGGSSTNWSQEHALSSGDRTQYAPVRRVEVCTKHDTNGPVYLDDAPVILISAARDWGALKDWSPQNAENCFPPSLVTVGLGRRATESHTTSSLHSTEARVNHAQCTVQEHQTPCCSCCPNATQVGTDDAEPCTSTTLHETQFDYITTSIHEFARWCQHGTPMNDYGSAAQSAKHQYQPSSPSVETSLDASQAKSSKSPPHSPHSHFGYVSYTSLSDIFPGAAFSMAQQALDWNGVLSMVDMQKTVETDVQSNNYQSATKTCTVPSSVTHTTSSQASAFRESDTSHDRATNFWFGTEDAVTQCHYDSYGCNFVTQIHGRKRWIMFPPSESSKLYPTRMPYEESSVFSDVNIERPDAQRHPLFRSAIGYEAILEPGDVLFVPRHWWHHVTCLSTSISVNRWLPHPSDDLARSHEALVRVLLAELLPVLDPAALARPREWLCHSEWFAPVPLCQTSASVPQALEWLQSTIKERARDTSDFQPEASGEAHNDANSGTRPGTIDDRVGASFTTEVTKPVVQPDDTSATPISSSDANATAVEEGADARGPTARHRALRSSLLRAIVHPDVIRVLAEKMLM